MNDGRHTRSGLNLLLFGLLCLTASVSLLSGDLHSFGLPSAQKPVLRNLILFEIRLPRLLLAMLIGFTLGLAGAVLQGLLRNPLAEPGIIGVSGGAALGAVIVIYFNLAGLGSLFLPLGGILGATLSMALLYLLAGRGRGNLYTLILAGIAINTLSAALTALALNLAPSPFALSEILFWLMGSVANRSMQHVWLITPFVIIGCTALFLCARGLDALTLGEQAAASLGIHVKRLKLVVILGAGLAVGASVSVAGAIGFVGLIVPHLMRRHVGHRPGALLLPSALAGATLLVFADLLVRLLPTGVELKLGVMTALFGAPFFIYLVLTRKADTVAGR